MFTILTPDCLETGNFFFFISFFWCLRGHRGAKHSLNRILDVRSFSVLGRK